MDEGCAESRIELLVFRHIGPSSKGRLQHNLRLFGRLKKLDTCGPRITIWKRVVSGSPKDLQSVLAGY
jgi:hypothetical protein